MIAEKGTEYEAFAGPLKTLLSSTGKEEDAREFVAAVVDILRRERAAIETDWAVRWQPWLQLKAWCRCGPPRFPDLTLRPAREDQPVAMKLKPDWHRFLADLRAPDSPLRIGGNFAVSLLLLALFGLAAKHLEWITRHFGGGWLFLAILVACVVLFYVRRFVRLGYGMLEIMIGLALVADTILGPAPDPTKLDEPVIKIAAGMYLAVRGIDNCMYWLTPKIGGAPAWVRAIFRSD